MKKIIMTYHLESSLNGHSLTPEQTVSSPKASLLFLSRNWELNLSEVHSSPISSAGKMPSVWENHFVLTNYPQSPGGLENPGRLLFTAASCGMDAVGAGRASLLQICFWKDFHGWETWEKISHRGRLRVEVAAPHPGFKEKDLGFFEWFSSVLLSNTIESNIDTGQSTNWLLLKNVRKYCTPDYSTICCISWNTRVGKDVKHTRKGWWISSSFSHNLYSSLWDNILYLTQQYNNQS